jgi:hypothetical protein
VLTRLGFRPTDRVSLWSYARQCLILQCRYALDRSPS